MNREVKEELNRILDETTTLEFPFLSGDKKKTKVLENTRLSIEEEIISSLETKDRKIFEKNSDELWKTAEEGARKEFDTLPSNLKINSFYLQEVMHRYVEATIALLDK